MIVWVFQAFKGGGQAQLAFGPPNLDLAISSRALQTAMPGTGNNEQPWHSTAKDGFDWIFPDAQPLTSRQRALGARWQIRTWS